MSAELRAAAALIVVAIAFTIAAVVDPAGAALFVVGVIAGAIAGFFWPSDA